MRQAVISMDLRVWLFEDHVAYSVQQSIQLCFCHIHQAQHVEFSIAKINGLIQERDRFYRFAGIDQAFTQSVRGCSMFWVAARVAS